MESRNIFGQWKPPVEASDLQQAFVAMGLDGYAFGAVAKVRLRSKN
jgi:hypothetical protein